MDKNYNFIEGKVIIITGASSGIGEATARLLARKGAIVYLGARREDKLKEIVDDINKNDGQANYSYLDVSNIDVCREFVNKVINKDKKIDVLINNAGVMLLSSVDNKKVDEWYRMIDINLKGCLNMIEACEDYMINNKCGHIINIGSTASYRVMENSSIYSATKFGIRALSDGIRKEFNKFGIKVSLISPGPTKSELTKHITSEDVKNNLGTYVNNCGLEANDVAKAIAFALSFDVNSSIDELIISPTRKMK